MPPHASNKTNKIPNFKDFFEEGLVSAIRSVRFSWEYKKKNDHVISGPVRGLKTNTLTDRQTEIQTWRLYN